MEGGTAIDYRGTNWGVGTRYLAAEIKSGVSTGKEEKEEGCSPLSDIERGGFR